jgi:hypothetical protein
MTPKNEALVRMTRSSFLRLAAFMPLMRCFGQSPGPQSQARLKSPVPRSGSLVVMGSGAAARVLLAEDRGFPNRSISESVPKRRTDLSRQAQTPVESEDVSSSPSLGLCVRLGGLCQEALRLAGACAPLSGPLHASSRDLQSLEDGKVTFRWKDYAHGAKQRMMTLSSDEFLRRFFLHVLPHGFVRIRFFGFLANRSRAKMLPLCRKLLETPSQQPTPDVPVADPRPPVNWKCPCRSGSMVIMGTLTAHELRWVVFELNTVDTS